MNDPESLVVVLTTIQPPTDAVRELHRRLRNVPARMIVAGDRKGPGIFDLDACEFLSLQNQLASGFRLAGKLPVGHYARKNMAYLQAVREGAGCIYETDDDNAPLPDWSPRTETLEKVRCLEGSGPAPSSWINVYRYFTRDTQIWPRGFPLERLADEGPACRPQQKRVRAPVQQGLVNGSPDVDAVWRLTQDRPFDFNECPSLVLESGQWCPFNTQSTWWWPVAYPLLYIPSFCSFRMCDIWKSFVAQRCLWAMGTGVVFHSPEVRQDRNPHDYLKDFKDEVPGVFHNAEIARILDGLSLSESGQDVPANLKLCYQALVDAGMLPPEEMDLVRAWLADLNALSLR